MCALTLLYSLVPNKHGGRNKRGVGNSENFNKRGGVRINGGWEFSEKFNKLKGNKAGITRYDRTRVLLSKSFGGKFLAKNARAQA